jgi:hypothetical protein
MARAAAADERDLGAVMVRPIDDFEGGDEVEVWMRGDETPQRTDDERRVVVEDVTVGHGSDGGCCTVSIERSK